MILSYNFSTVRRVIIYPIQEDHLNISHLQATALQLTAVHHVEDQ